MSIIVPTKIVPFKHNKFTRKSIIILVWGGLRGGVSIALALSIDEQLNKNLLAITYFVVVFSIIVQGLTIGKRTRPKSGEEANAPEPV